MVMSASAHSLRFQAFTLFLFSAHCLTLLQGASVLTLSASESSLSLLITHCLTLRDAPECSPLPLQSSLS
eukprot:20781-Rhodomonas_salina.1